MDVLIRLFEIEKRKKEKFDTYIGNGAILVSHLMYADDIQIFTKANPKSLKFVKSILDKFSAFSDMRSMPKEFHHLLQDL